MKTILISFFSLCLLHLAGSLVPAVAHEKNLTNTIGMEFVLIPAGSFTMGSDKKLDADAGDDELPPHQVIISKPFYLGKYEVTQAQWQAVMGKNPSRHKRRNNPVEKVSWNDVQEFIKRLNRKEGHNQYRLPTEAEWEYAARAGNTTAYSFGNTPSALKKYAWYDENSGETPCPVGQKLPSAWGLYDMHGNVWEWVGDWYGKNYYAASAGTDPKGPSSGTRRVARGGGWLLSAKDCRSAIRFSSSPGLRHSILGFRLARSTGQ